jgi:cbb3-type cytochrome oxidase subunit 3
METEATDKPLYKKPGFIATIIVLALFIVYYCVMSLLGPVRKLNAIQSEYGIIHDKKNPIDERIFSDSAYLKLLKEKAFLQSRITMAETDSIYLTINLADSTVKLEISGVVVHSTDIKKKNISKVLKRGDGYDILTMLSKPLVIAKDFSSIKKEPLMIKMAPKDTSEFQPDIIPDTADFEPVNFILEMQNGVRIYIYQDENLKFGDGLRRFGFDLWDRIRNTLSSMKKVVTFRVPEYHPFIKIRLNRADAKIIYRAIPYHGQVAVYR